MCPSDGNDGKRMRAVLENTLCIWLLSATALILPRCFILLGPWSFYDSHTWAYFPVDNKSWLHLMITSQLLVIAEYDLLTNLPGNSTDLIVCVKVNLLFTGITTTLLNIWSTKFIIQVSTGPLVVTQHDVDCFKSKWFWFSASVKGINV